MSLEQPAGFFAERAMQNPAAKVTSEQLPRGYKLIQVLLERSEECLIELSRGLRAVWAPALKPHREIFLQSRCEATNGCGEGERFVGFRTH